MKRSLDDEENCADPSTLSKKKLKQLNKLKNKEIRCQRILEELCSECRNPKVLYYLQIINTMYYDII